jgi:hypothetical protein
MFVFKNLQSSTEVNEKQWQFVKVYFLFLIRLFVGFKAELFKIVKFEGFPKPKYKLAFNKNWTHTHR